MRTQEKKKKIKVTGKGSRSTQKYSSFLMVVPALGKLYPELNITMVAVTNTSEEVCTRYKSFKGAKAQRSSWEYGNNTCSKSHVKKSWWLMMILS